MPFWISLKVPLALAGVGLVVALLSNGNAELTGPFFMVAVLWVMVTGRARKTYWNARLRARASHDERDARRRAAAL